MDRIPKFIFHVNMLKFMKNEKLGDGIKIGVNMVLMFGPLAILIVGAIKFFDWIF